MTKHNLVSFRQNKKKVFGDYQDNCMSVESQETEVLIMFKSMFKYCIWMCQHVLCF